jgi:uncharacterized protein (DUF4415 family)
MAKTSKIDNGASKPRAGSAAKARARASVSKPQPVGRPQIDAGRAGWATDLVFDVREPKLAVSLRLDADVLRFFRGFGSGYQTRINEVLKAFMQARGGAENGAHTIPAARLPRVSAGAGNGKRAR